MFPDKVIRDIFGYSHGNFIVVGSLEKIFKYVTRTGGALLKWYPGLIGVFERYFDRFHFEGDFEYFLRNSKHCGYGKMVSSGESVSFSLTWNYCGTRTK